MTSAIDPSNIDENYPVPGQPNNTQGFRDNFAGTKTNFQAAAAEISQLQQRAILKSALPGTVLDNNLSDQPLVAARIRDFSTNLVEIPTSAGVVTVDYSLGHYQRIATTGNVSLAFANLPGIESSGTVRVQFTIDQAGRTVTLPSGASGNVAYGKVGIQGLATGTNTITFAEAGVYDFEFTAVNSDGTPLINIVDCNRPMTYYTNGVGINNATPSTDVNNGALVVAGGIGVGGNVYGGNLLTPGAVSAAGNVTGNYIIGDGGFLSNVTVVSNVAVTQIANGTTTLAVNGSGGNITFTVGGAANRIVVSNTTTAVTSNVAVTGNASITGTLALGANITTNLNVTGTVNSGNLITVGEVIAAGNVTGAYLFGNGSLLDGIHEDYLISGNSYLGFGVANGNANISVGNTANVVVVSTTGVRVTGIVSATGNVTGGNLIGGRLALSSSVIGNILATGYIKTNNGYGIGYATGSGGTAIQGSNKSNGVTLDRICGEITMNNQSLGAGASATFTLTNSTVENTDVMIVNIVGGGTIGAYIIDPICNSGSANITVTNRTAGALAEAIVLRFAVIKAVTS